MPDPHTPVTPVAARRRRTRARRSTRRTPITLQPRLQRDRIDAHPLDRPGRRPLPAADLGALERRSGRARRRELASGVAEHDLGVGADVDEQLHAARRGAVPRRASPPRCRRRRARRCTVRRRTTRTAGRARARRPARRPHASVASANGACPSGVGSMPSTRWCMIGLPTTTTSSTESRVTPAASTSSPSSSSSARAYGAGELLVAARVHHHVRHPAHQVLAEADLRVHPPGRREHLAGGEVAQVAGDGGRADVDRRPHDALAVPGPHGDDHAVAHGHGHRRVVRAARRHRPGDRAPAPRRPRRSTAVVAVVTATPCWSATRRGQLVDDARDVGSEHRGSELDVVRGHQRVDHEGRRGRGPCARPGGAPGSPRARRSRRRRRCAAAQPSRWPATSGRLPR